jgi:hypothetical protein
MRITTCDSLADKEGKEKRHFCRSGAFCVNDGAVRYGPRRLLWLLHRRVFAKVDL